MTSHLADGDLVRHLDDAGDAVERLAVAGHLETCAECARRLEALAQRSARVETALAATAPVIPRLPRPRTSRWRRTSAIAAGIALMVLGGAAVTVQPVRAWLVEQTRAVWATFAGPGEDASPTLPLDSAEAAPVRPTTAAVEFVPSGNSFTVRLESRQRFGDLVLITGPVERATALVIDGTELESVLVVPDGIVVRNAEGSRASYRITVPAVIDSVRIQVAGELLASFLPGGADSSWTVSFEVAR